MAVNEDVVVSAETLDSRNGGGCLPASRELPLDSTVGCNDVLRFRFARVVDADSVGLGILSDFVVTADSCCLGTGESWILNIYTESADHEPTNSLGLASENLQAVIWTLRRAVGSFPLGENRRTHCCQHCLGGKYLRWGI